MAATMGNLLFPTGAAPARRQSKQRAPSAPTWQKLEAGAVLLAIDPSSSNCGWCVMRFAGTGFTGRPEYIDSGVFHPIDSDRWQKLEHLSLLIAQRIRLSREAGNEITDALVEIPRGGGLGGELMMVYGQSVGVCRATCFRAGLQMHTIGANQWRSCTKDAKRLTMLAVQQTFKECVSITENNRCDAIGLAMFLCERSRMRGR